MTNRKQIDTTNRYYRYYKTKKKLSKHSMQKTAYDCFSWLLYQMELTQTIVIRSIAHNVSI